MSVFESSRGEFRDIDAATQQEWLVTNGLGGYAAGTAAQANTRRYHGLLVAALAPPLGRTLTVAKLDTTVSYGDEVYEIACNEFVDGAVDPRGFHYIERFYLDEGLPVWEYAVGDALLEQRIVMPHGANSTLVQFRVLRASAALRLTLRPLCSYRDYHSHTQGGWDIGCEQLDDGFRIHAFEGAQTYEIRSIADAEIDFSPEWYWRFHHRIEASRGLDDSEDLYGPGSISADLSQGDTLPVLISTEANGSLDFEGVLREERARSEGLLALAGIDSAPGFVRQWVRAADQFVVARHSGDGTTGRTVIAGYPWFGDWGRDTMIALPGLTLTTRRFDVARDILETFAEHIDRGMLPNRFPDSGEEPEYNTVDATLWYVHAVREYTISGGDYELASQLMETLRAIVDWHRQGTRYGIQVDPTDGLLAAGEEGVQLTWMDAKVGDWVVTPRIGKAVEINALWYNALAAIADLCGLLGDTAAASNYNDQAQVVAHSFQRFWSDQHAYLYDVIDGFEGAVADDGTRSDPALRPNQIFAVSLPFSPLDNDKQRAVVDACARKLVTSYGLRSLSGDDENYVGKYGGGPLQRDGAYHQGTVWPWLLAPFAEAHFRVYGDARQARSFLRPLGAHLREACVGSVSEIFDGDPPHLARGCFAQAWSVAEPLRVWTKLSSVAEPVCKETMS